MVLKMRRSVQEESERPKFDPDTMESRNLKGLYLTGELLDVDGICGGYNLQFAWATGYLAGCAAAGDRKDTKRDIKDDSN